jgi:hypothetical protein
MFRLHARIDEYFSTFALEILIGDPVQLRAVMARKGCL